MDARRGNGEGGVRLELCRRAAAAYKEGERALAESVAFLACVGDQRVAVWGSAITGARKGKRGVGEEGKGEEALTCGVRETVRGKGRRAGAESRAGRCGAAAGGPRWWAAEQIRSSGRGASWATRWSWAARATTCELGRREAGRSREREGRRGLGQVWSWAENEKRNIFQIQILFSISKFKTNLNMNQIMYKYDLKYTF